MSGWSLYLQRPIAVAVLIGFCCTMPTSVLSANVVGDLPLPKGVQRLSSPYEMTMGTQPMQVQGFMTSLSREQVLAFYEKVLPTLDWRIQALPWVETSQQKFEAFQQIAKEHAQEIEANPDQKAQAASVSNQGLQEAKKHLLYAVRGKERLLLKVHPNDQRTTLVVVSRWMDTSLQSGDVSSGENVGSAISPFGSSTPTHGQEGSSWPASNPCCSGEQVPAAFHKLPSSIPQYQNARLVMSGSPLRNQTNQSSITELSLTSDPLDQVVEYYRDHMTYNGWTLDEGLRSRVPGSHEVPGPQGKPIIFKVNVLPFRKDHIMCVITISESPEDLDLSGRLQNSLPAMPADMAAQAKTALEAGPTERTAILVNYMEIPSMDKPLWRGRPNDR